MADIQNELSSLAGKKALDPLEQTIFEKGPQNSFTPPEVANIYQEGKTIFPTNQVGVSQGINWGAIGENAANLANKAYLETLDYLVGTQAAGVADAKDQAQSKLLDIEAQMSTEAFNANKEQRPRAESLVEKLKQESLAIKGEYTSKVQKIFGDNYATLTNPDLDMGTLGTRYQELALSNLKGTRDIDRTYNNIMYKLERVTRGAQQMDQSLDFWKFNGGKAPDNAIPLAFMGAAPIPMKDGAPYIGVDETGKVRLVQVGDQQMPLLIGNSNDPSDKNLYLNRAAFDGLTHEEREKLIELDQSGIPGSFAMSHTGDLVKPYADLIKYAAIQPNSSTGNMDTAGILLNRMTPQQSSSFINSLGLSPEQEMKLHWIKAATRDGVSAKNMGDISNASPETIRSASNSVLLLTRGTSGLIKTDVKDPSKLQDLQLTAEAFSKVLSQLGATQQAPITIEQTGNEGFTESTHGQVARTLSENPDIGPMVTRALAYVKQNSGLYTDAKGEVDAANRSQLLADIIHSQISREGWHVITNSNDGTPIFSYSPGLSEFNQVKDRIINDPLVTKGVSPAIVNKLKDPTKQGEVFAKASLWDTNISDISGNTSDLSNPEAAYEAANQMFPGVHKDTFLKLFDAYRPVEREPQYGIRMTSGKEITAVELARLAIASHSNVLKKFGIEDIASANEDDILRTSKRVIDDLPMYSGNRPGAAPFISVDFDTSPRSYGYMSSMNGGLPVKITSLTGEGGTNYLKLMFAATQFPDGQYLPMNGQTPVLMVRATHPTQNGQLAYSGDYKKNMDKMLLAERGDWEAAATNDDAPAGAQIIRNPDDTKNLIAYTTEPYLPDLGKTIFANKLVDEPLKGPEAAIAFVHQHGAAIERVMQSDDTLKKGVNFLYELAYVPGSGEMRDDKKVLFTPENLKNLYAQAVAHGAKTQADYLGFVLGAVKNAVVNPTAVRERDFVAQQQSKSSSKEDIVSSGEDKGRILWKYNTPSFLDVTTNAVREGKIVFTGPAPENPRTLAFYAFKPDEVPPTMKERGFTVAADQTMLPRIEASPSGQMQKIRMESARRREILFPSPAKPNDSLSALTRQSTLPSDMTRDYQKALEEFTMSKSLNEFTDVPFIDLAAYFTDFGRMPESVDNLPPKYILPGHSSTLPWAYQVRNDSAVPAFIKKMLRSVDKAKVDPAAYRNEQIYPEETTPQEGAILANTVLGATSATGNFVGKNVSAAANWIDGTYIGHTLFDVTKNLKDAAVAVLNMDATLQDQSNKADNQMPFEELYNYRQKVIAEFKRNPTAWFRIATGGDEVSYLRKAPPNQENDKVPEKVYDIIHFIAGSGSEYDPNLTKGLLSKDQWSKLQNMGWSPLEVEYELRVQLKNSKDYKQDLSNTIDKLDSDTFVLDPKRQSQLEADLMEASKQIGQPLNLQDARVLASTPAWRPDIKREFFKLGLYPDGFVSRAGKTSRESRIEALAQLLQQQQ